MTWKLELGPWIKEQNKTTGQSAVCQCFPISEYVSRELRICMLWFRSILTNWCKLLFQDQKPPQLIQFPCCCHDNLIFTSKATTFGLLSSYQKPKFFYLVNATYLGQTLVLFVYTLPWVRNQKEQSSCYQQVLQCVQTLQQGHHFGQMLTPLSTVLFVWQTSITHWLYFFQQYHQKLQGCSSKNKKEDRCNI